jgi:hypothetical protein
MGEQKRFMSRAQHSPAATTTPRSLGSGRPPSILAGDRDRSGTLGLLPDPACDFDSLCQVTLGINLRDVRLAVPQHDLGGLQAKLATDLGRRAMPQLVWRPAMSGLPLLKLGQLLSR